MEGKIKQITNVKDFKKVYKVFSGPPYYEKYTDEEFEAIFKEYQEGGYIYGAYNGDECVGLLALERGAKSNQPVDFQVDEKIMYLADVAVLANYRKQGIGNQLMIYGVLQSKSLGYDKLYMRTLARGSMSYGIALKIGFKQIPNLFQGVERERVNGSTDTMQNIFLVIDLNSLDIDNLRKAITMAVSNRNKEGQESRGD